MDQGKVKISFTCTEVFASKYFWNVYEDCWMKGPPKSITEKIRKTEVILFIVFWHEDILREGKYNFKT